MIKSLDIKNFQSWKSAHFEFHPGFNVIVGPSDAGKSAIIRALNWVITNSDPGVLAKNFSINDILRWDEKEASASIAIDGLFDDVVITRRQTGSGGVNEYRLSTETEPFRAIGRRGIPPKIAELLNMDESNFQYQMDSAFLLSSSSGETSRYLNRVIDLDVIDETLSNLNSTAREEKRTLVQAENDLDILNKKSDTFSWLDTADGVITQLEHFSAEIAKTFGDRNKLFDLIAQIDELEPEYDRIMMICQEWHPVINQLIADDEEIAVVLEHRNRLANLITEIEQLEAQQIRCQEVLRFEKVVTDLQLLLGDIENKQMERNKLSQIIYEIEDLEAKWVTADQAVNAAEINFEEMFPDVCPLCGCTGECRHEHK